MIKYMFLAIFMSSWLPKSAYPFDRCSALFALEELEDYAWPLSIVDISERVSMLGPYKFTPTKEGRGVVTRTTDGAETDLSYRDNSWEFGFDRNSNNVLLRNNDEGWYSNNGLVITGSTTASPSMSEPNQILEFVKRNNKLTLEKLETSDARIKMFQRSFGKNKAVFYRLVNPIEANFWLALNQYFKHGLISNEFKSAFDAELRYFDVPELYDPNYPSGSKLRYHKPEQLRIVDYLKEVIAAARRDDATEVERLVKTNNEILLDYLLGLHGSGRKKDLATPLWVSDNLNWARNVSAKFGQTILKFEGNLFDPYQWKIAYWGEYSEACPRTNAEKIKILHSDISIIK